MGLLTAEKSCIKNNKRRQDRDTLYLNPQCITGGVSQDVGGGASVYGSHGSYRGTSYTDQWVQYQWCINERNKELAKLKAWKWKWGLIIWLPIPILISITLLVLTKLEVKGFSNPKAGTGSILMMGLFVGLLLGAIVWWIAKMFAPKPDRYRARHYRKYIITDNCHYSKK